MVPIGEIEGEMGASTILINERRKVEGEVAVQESDDRWTVKGTIHANRVKVK